MGLEGIDVPTIGGGLSILGAMMFVIKVAFSRLERQDSAWLELLEAAERRALAAEATLAELRLSILSDKSLSESLRLECKAELERLTEELKEAKLQIKELQKWDGEIR